MTGHGTRPAEARPGSGVAARVLLAVALAAPIGCSAVGPEYEPPPLELPAAYHAALPGLFQAGPAPERWWTLFADERLNGLVESGLEQNLSLQVAASRVREARALAEGAGAQSSPEVGIRGTAQRRQSANVSDFASTDDPGSVRADLTAVWEIDLFGRLQHTREAAQARAAAQAAQRQEVARLTAAEIARTYLDLRAAQRRLALTRQSLASQSRTLTLVRNRVEAGLAPGLDRVRAQAAVATLQANLGPSESEVERLANALGVLLAAPPGSLTERIAAPDELPGVRTGAALGAPAEVVRRRPDVQAAELNIVAATADVGIAMTELYPSLSLQGAIGAGVTGVGTGDPVESVLASLSLLVNIPLFDGGVRKANITAAEERVVQATLLYRETVLRALEEIESALLGYEGARQRREALAVAVSNNQHAYDQSRELYREGFVSFLEVLDSQRAWTTSRQELATAERDQSRAVVNLFTAIGGSILPAEPGEAGQDTPQGAAPVPEPES